MIFFLQGRHSFSNIISNIIHWLLFLPHVLHMKNTGVALYWACAAHGIDIDQCFYKRHFINLTTCSSKSKTKKCYIQNTVCHLLISLSICLCRLLSIPECLARISCRSFHSQERTVNSILFMASSWIRHGILQQRLGLYQYAQRSSAFGFQFDSLFGWFSSDIFYKNMPNEE